MPPKNIREKEKKPSRKIKELSEQTAHEILSLMISEEDRDTVTTLLMSESEEDSPKKQLRLRFRDGSYLVTTIMDLINDGVPGKKINKTPGIANGFPTIPPSNNRLHIVDNPRDNTLQTVVRILDNVETNSLNSQEVEVTPDNRTKLAILNSGLDKTDLDVDVQISKTNLDLDQIIDKLNPDQIFESTIYLAGNAVKWQIRLDELSAIKSMSSAEINEQKELKTRICGYNKLIKEFINTFGNRADFSFSAVLDTMRDKIISQYPDLKLRESREALEEIINGMRYELLFEMQIIQDNEYEIKSAPIELDLKGVDYILTDTSGRDILVDIKSSIRGVQEGGSSREHYRWVTKYGKNILVIWPSVEYEEFEGKISPPKNNKSRKTLDIIKQALAA